MPKICIYTIVKNEISYVERYMNSVKDADYVVIADTGSTDGTDKKFTELGAIVHSIKVDPFRFDVARNKS